MKKRANDKRHDQDETNADTQVDVAKERLKPLSQVPPSRASLFFFISRLFSLDVTTVIREVYVPNHNVSNDSLQGTKVWFAKVV